MANANIRLNEDSKDIELYVEGNFIAGWNPDVYDFTDKQRKLIGYMCGEAVNAGKRIKEKQLRKAIGL